MNELLVRIGQGLEGHGFRDVQISQEKLPECVLLLKRQTLNTNRAVVVIELEELPAELVTYLKRIRGIVARKVRFFPLLWGVGIQVVLVCPGSTMAVQDP